MRWADVDRCSAFEHIGSGCNGAVYRFTLGNHRYALKKTLVRSASDRAVRNELAFVQTVAHNRPTRFVSPVLTRVRRRGPDEHLPTNRRFVVTAEREHMDQVDGERTCVYEAVYPLLEKSADVTDLRATCLWLVDTVRIMRDAGMSHNDMHRGNMVYRAGVPDRPALVDFADSSRLNQFNNYHDLVQLVLVMTYNPTFGKMTARKRPYAEYIKLVMGSDLPRRVRALLGGRSPVPRVFVDYMAWIVDPGLAYDFMAMSPDGKDECLRPALVAFDSVDSLLAVVRSLVAKDLGETRRLVRRHGLRTHDTPAVLCAGAR